MSDAADEATVQPTDIDTQGRSHDELVDILGLNLLWTDGQTLVGSRLNRTLWALERTSVYACPICGHNHADPSTDGSYRSTTLASERLTNESWEAVPNGTVFSAGEDARLHVELLHETD